MLISQIGPLEPIQNQDHRIIPGCPGNPYRFIHTKCPLSHDIQRPGANTCIITHSLGGTALLHYLTSLEGVWELHGLFIVSGFVEKLRVIPELDEFIGQAHVDVPAIKHHIVHTEVLVSTNDVLVDPVLTLQLADALSAVPITIHDAGHFLEDDGYTEFPQLGDRITQWLHSL